MADSGSNGSMSANDANNWLMIKTALETAKQRRSGLLLLLVVVVLYIFCTVCTL